MSADRRVVAAELLEQVRQVLAGPASVTPVSRRHLPPPAIGPLLRRLEEYLEELVEVAP